VGAWISRPSTAAGTTAGGAGGGERAALGQQRELGRSEEFELADQPVAARVAPAASGTRPHGVAEDPDRQLRFERLDRCVQRVGHVRMHSRSAAMRRAAPGAAGQRLVVGELAPIDAAAEREVVH
jgi:hypothetical protein